MAEKKKAEPRLPICPRCTASTPVKPLTMSDLYDDVEY
jgi:hypothetical protein